jgi:flagellar hook-associated protein 2
MSSVDYLSALNKQGSGLNITQIVDSLVQAETAPLSSQIEQKIEKSNQQISGYAVVAAELGKMKDYTASIKGSTAYSVSSDNGAVGARVIDQSQAADFNAKISVSSLAVAQTLEFTGFSSKSDTIGTGTINIDFGDWSSGSFVMNNNKTGQTITINLEHHLLNKYYPPIQKLKDWVN